MTAGARVVTLTADDYDAIVDLWRAAGLPTRPRGRDSREAFARQIDGGTQTALGVQMNGKLVGVVLATHDGRKGWINRLAVHPDCRRQGIGQRLLAEAERALKAQGMTVIAALIEGPNAASQALFRQAGYETHPDIQYLSKRDSADV